MDITEAQAKKKETEKKISDLIKIFADETGLTVHSLDVDCVKVNPIGMPSTTVYHTNIECLI